MHDGDVDYSKYGLRELEEALDGINRQRYPKNYANLCSAYQLLTNALPPPRTHAQEEGLREIEPAWAGPKFDENGRYVPNDIPPKERIGHLVLSLLLLAYGTYGVLANDLYIPIRGRTRDVHLQDVPAWIMYGAILCACFVMLSVIIDHYDRRNNERHYRTFASVAEVLGWSFFTVSLVWAGINGA